MMSPLPILKLSSGNFEPLYPLDDVYFPLGEIREFLIEAEIKIERERMK